MGLCIFLLNILAAKMISSTHSISELKFIFLLEHSQSNFVPWKDYNLFQFQLSLGPKQMLPVAPLLMQGLQRKTQPGLHLSHNRFDSHLTKVCPRVQQGNYIISYLPLAHGDESCSRIIFCIGCEVF